MKIEDQVVSLDLAKRLKELGVKQDSLFWWHQSTLSEDCYLREFKSDRGISAFTVAELGNILSKDFNWSQRHYYVDYTFSFEIEGVDFKKIFYADNYGEADSRAALIIYLIENNLLKL